MSTEKEKQENGAKKPEEKKVISLKEKTIQQLLDEKLSKIQVVQKLSNKLLSLRKTQTKFDEFTIGTDGQKDCLTIRDSERHEFETTNSDTIKKVVEILKVDLTLKIVETEKQISEAQI